uniref:beta-defensin 105A-like n=1 Tax=Nyctereutes procyonoides TaxID=34880 RepID=UPI002443D6DF|nr:beta-defensin 105A-like [Nyctereutes procyonoides]
MIPLSSKVIANGWNGEEAGDKAAGSSVDHRCQAGLDYSQPFPGGDFAVCEPCWLGRGKCRRICTEDEKVVGNCKMNFFCCRRRIR